MEDSTPQGFTPGMVSATSNLVTCVCMNRNKIINNFTVEICESVGEGGRSEHYFLSLPPSAGTGVEQLGGKHCPAFYREGSEITLA